MTPAYQKTGCMKLSYILYTPTLYMKDKYKIKAEMYKIIWASLDSHLKWMYTHSSEGKAFHRRCVDKGYSRLLYLLSQL